LNYLHQILSGEKNAVRTTDICPLKIPKVPECSVAKLYPIANRNNLFPRYMPDEWNEGVKVDRTFFYQIWVYLEQGLVEDVIKDIRRQRFQRLKMNEPRPIVNIAPHWAELLLNVHKRPCKYLR
jgi:hypothetical protein